MHYTFTKKREKKKPGAWRRVTKKDRGECLILDDCYLLKRYYSLCEFELLNGASVPFTSLYSALTLQHLVWEILWVHWFSVRQAFTIYAEMSVLNLYTIYLTSYFSLTKLPYSITNTNWLLYGLPWTPSEPPSQCEGRGGQSRPAGADCMNACVQAFLRESIAKG